MRYLRKFENLQDRFTTDELSEIRNKCEMYLAYLVDNGFDIDIDNTESTHSCIDITQSNTLDAKLHFTETGDGVSWSEIKDNIIPLISLFMKGDFDCQLLNIEFFFWRKRPILVEAEDFEDFINDRPHSFSLEDLEGNGISCITLEIKK